MQEVISVEFPDQSQAEILENKFLDYKRYAPTEAENDWRCLQGAKYSDLIIDVIRWVNKNKDKGVVL